jgi:CMP-N-acetylneuraminic acid synthetase
MRYFVIPARRNSKGLPFKNRKLFPLTADTIPREELKNTVVSTDDEEIRSLALKTGMAIHDRSAGVSDDTASTTDLMKEVATNFEWKDEDDVIMLYLTYPQRTYQDIENIYSFYKSKNGNTLLCKQEATTHPYMCYYDLPDNKGMRVINHDLYRRQDYPECFFVSYFVAIFKVGFLKLLNKNLNHPQTLFYPLPYDSIDVDTQEDLENFLNK